MKDTNSQTCHLYYIWYMLYKYININVRTHACYLGIYNLMMRPSWPRCHGQVCGLIPLVSTSNSLTAHYWIKSHQFKIVIRSMCLLRVRIPKQLTVINIELSLLFIFKNWSYAAPSKLWINLYFKENLLN